MSELSGSAVRDIFSEPLIRVLPDDTPEQIVAMCLAELSSRFSERQARELVSNALSRNRQGRPSREGLEPRERRLLDLYDWWPRRADGRPDNKGFAERFQAELSPQSPEAAEKHLQRLLRLRKSEPRPQRAASV